MIDAQFIKKDEITQTDILLALEDKVFFNVKTVDTTNKNLQGCLNIVHEDAFLVNKIYLKLQLYNLKMKDNVSIHDHLNYFNSLVTDLQGIRVKIDNEEQVLVHF